MQPTEFYHGTSLEAILAIQESGFRVELSGSNAGAALGPGIYVTTTLLKALTYAQGTASKPNPAGGGVLMLEIDLGRCYHVRSSSQAQRTSWIAQDFDSAWAAEGVIGEREENCVRDPARIRVTNVVLANTRAAQGNGYTVRDGRLRNVAREEAVNKGFFGAAKPAPADSATPAPAPATGLATPAFTFGSGGGAISSEVRTLVGQLRSGWNGQTLPTSARALSRAFSLTEEAAEALWILMYRDANNQVAIAIAGGIAPLVALTHGGTRRQKYLAAGALRSLAFNDDNKVAIAAAGGIAPLVALARGGTDRQKEKAADALGLLAVNDDNRVAIARAGGIAPLVALARGGLGLQKEYAADALWRLSYNNTNLAAMKDLGYGAKSFFGGWTVPQG